MPAPLDRRAFGARFASLLAAPLLPALPRVAQAAGGAYGERPEAMQWASALAAHYSLPEPWVRAAIAQAQFLPRVPRLMLPAAPSSRNWRSYRRRMVEPVRIRAGARFWRQHTRALERAHARYGVPPEIVCGILGIETLYGRNMGSFRVLDALATLTFDFPATHPRAAARQAYFAGQPGHFMLLCQRMGLSPGQPLGSYAGAMGIAQFMPSSWLRYAVDFDGDGSIDLWHSAADAIGSVASYFAGYGWKAGVPTHWGVHVAADADLAQLLASDITPSMSAAQMRALGATPLGSGSQYGGKLALIELPNGTGVPEYVVGSENFYVVTRYNHSSFYAMAVLELGEAVAQAVRGRAAAK